LKPKIAIIITTDGIDSVSILSNDRALRNEGYRILPVVESEINKFETAFKRKLKKELDYVKEK